LYEKLGAECDRLKLKRQSLERTPENAEFQNCSRSTTI